MLKRALLGLIKSYQKYVRRYIPSSCRYYPSCSEYAHQAIEKFGVLNGGAKACIRLCHCHPFSKKNPHYPVQ